MSREDGRRSGVVVGFLGDRHRRILRGFIEGVATGVLCAVASTLVLTFVRVATLELAKRCIADGVPVEICTAPLVGSVSAPLPALIFPALVGPLIETGFFYVVFKLLVRRNRSKTRLRLYIVLMSFLGWLLHGFSFQSVNRVLPFGFLALLYVRWSKEGNLDAFLVTSWAHVVYNSSIFILYYFFQ